MNNWQIKKLGEICIVKPPKSEARKKLNDNDVVSFVPMEDLGILNKNLNLSQTKKLKEVVESYTYFADDDVLMAKITPCFENGKLGIAKNLKNGIGFGSSEYVVFRTNDDLLPEYLFYFLSTKKFREEGSKNMRGAAGHKRVSKEFIKNFTISFPPLLEQKRLVALLDELFEKIEKANENTKKNLKNSKELFESWLKDRIHNPDNDWAKQQLGEIAENLDRKRIPITKKDRINGDFPYYGASGIVDYVNDYIFDEDLLLISEDGANLLARTYPIAFSISGKTWVNNHAHVLKFKKKITQKFVEYYLNSINLVSYISGMAQPKLNQASLNSIEIHLPEISEQKSIVESFDKLSTNTKKIESLYQQKLNNLEELKQSILHQAFTGKL